MYLQLFPHELINYFSGRLTDPAYDPTSFAATKFQDSNLSFVFRTQSSIATFSWALEAYLIAHMLPIMELMAVGIVIFRLEMHSDIFSLEWNETLCEPKDFLNVELGQDEFLLAQHTNYTPCEFLNTTKRRNPL